MLYPNVHTQEKDYYYRHIEHSLPDLLCFYLEKQQYELTYFLAEKSTIFCLQARFYQMITLMAMGYEQQAFTELAAHKEEWFELCKQGNIYWKHVALFALAFQILPISSFYEDIFEEYYDSPIIQLLKLLQEESPVTIQKTQLYKTTCECYPFLKAAWKHLQPNFMGILTYETATWNIWKKYNQNISKNTQEAMTKVFQQDGISIYSYQPWNCVASMHLITDGKTSILLDCGSKRTPTDSCRLPIRQLLSNLNVTRPDAVLVSHAHLDHYGSINELTNLPIYMSIDTRQLIQLSSPEISLQCVHILKPYDSITINSVTIRFLPNGHILGSVLMDIDWKGQKRIVYTGDYSTEQQRTVSGFRVEDLFSYNQRKVDVLLTETTFGKRTDLLHLSHYQKMFTDVCRKYIESGNKLLIPCAAIGKAQEIALLLSDLASELGLRILIDGKASKITEYYQLSLRKNILGKNVSIASQSFDYSEKIQNYDIILSTCETLHPDSTSAAYLEQLLNQKHIAIISTGAIPPGEHLYQTLQAQNHPNITHLHIPLYEHPCRDTLITTTQKISPDYAIFVHGNGI